MIPDQIEINAIRVSTHIGVPDEERATAQTVEVDLILVPKRGFVGLDDDIEQTVNYYEIWQQVRMIAAERPRKLIETLAEEFASALLRDAKLDRVRVEVRKFILPDTASVSVSIWRPADSQS